MEWILERSLRKMAWRNESGSSYKALMILKSLRLLSASYQTSDFVGLTPLAKAF